MTFNMGILLSHEEAIVATIKWEVRLRLLAKGRFKDLSSHLGLVYRWHLHPLL
jgi:hypothetical protein